MSSFAQTLDDGPIGSGGTLAIGGALQSSSPTPQIATTPQREDVVPAMPTDTFTPLPGEMPRRRCCGGSRAAMPVINLNINAGNNNGNNNGNNGAANRGGTYVDTPSGFDAPVQTRIQRVEVPVEKIVEKPVYKPMVVVREIVRKIKEYVPFRQVYERRVGKPYNDQPISFEGSAARTTTKTTQASTSSTAVAPAGIMPGDQPVYENATMSMTLPKP